MLFVSDEAVSPSVAISSLGAQAGVAPANVACGSLQNIGVVLKPTDSGIAIAADKTANTPGRMTMVDMKAGGSLAVAGFVGTADRTDATLVFKDCVVLGKSDAVVVVQVLLRFVIRVFRIASSSIATLFFGAVTSALALVDAVFTLSSKPTLLHRKVGYGFGGETLGALAHP